MMLSKKSSVNKSFKYVPIQERTPQVLKTKEDKIEVHKAKREEKEEEEVLVRDEKYAGKKESAEEILFR